MADKTANEKSGERVHRVVISPDSAGARLDKALATALTSLSRSRIKVLVLAGSVRADGATITDPSYGVKPGQTLTLIEPAAIDATPAPQELALHILHEDAHLVVLEKPAGLVVHPAPGNPDRTLVNALIAHCGDSLSGIGGVRRPGIVHRLDKDTSGLMVVAKTDAAHQGLARQFAAREVERAYVAVAWGILSPRRGEISGNIGRSRANRKKMAVVGRGGKPALTRYNVLDTFGGIASQVECHLSTGRTHQIRVHLAAKGHPVIGDPLYGRSRRKGLKDLPGGVQEALTGLHRQALHARLIGFTHPETAEYLKFESELPSDINHLLRNLALK